MDELYKLLNRAEDQTMSPKNCRRANPWNSMS